MLRKLPLAIAAAASLATVAHASSATFQGEITPGSAFEDATGSFQIGDRFVGSFIWDSSATGVHTETDRTNFDGAFKSAKFDVIRDGTTIYTFDLKARTSVVAVDSLEPGVAYYVGFYETSDHPYLKTNLSLPFNEFRFSLDFGNGEDGGKYGTPYEEGKLPGAINFTKFNSYYAYLEVFWFNTGTNDYLHFQSPITAQGVPEPATWALMIGGFGLVGAQARRRYRLKSVV